MLETRCRQSHFNRRHITTLQIRGPGLSTGESRSFSGRHYPPVGNRHPSNRPGSWSHVNRHIQPDPTPHPPSSGHLRLCSAMHPPPLDAPRLLRRPETLLQLGPAPLLLLLRLFSEPL